MLINSTLNPEPKDDIEKVEETGLLKNGRWTKKLPCGGKITTDRRCGFYLQKPKEN